MQGLLGDRLELIVAYVWASYAEDQPRPFIEARDDLVRQWPNALDEQLPIERNDLRNVDD